MTLFNRLDAEQAGADLTIYQDRPADDPTHDDRVYFTTDQEFVRSFAADTRIVDATTGIVYYRHATCTRSSLSAKSSPTPTSSAGVPSRQASSPSPSGTSS